MANPNPNNPYNYDYDGGINLQQSKHSKYSIKRHQVKASSFSNLYRE